MVISSFKIICLISLIGLVSLITVFAQDDFGSGSFNVNPGSGAYNVNPGSGILNVGGSGIPGLQNPFGSRANDLPSLISYLVGVAQSFAIAIAVLIIIYGAYRMLFAAGDPKEFKVGVDVIKYAVIGLAIVLLANGIVDIIKNIFQ